MSEAAIGKGEGYVGKGAGYAGKGPPDKAAGKGPPGKAAGKGGKGPPSKGKDSVQSQRPRLSYKEQKEKEQRELEELLSAAEGFKGREEGLTAEEQQVMVKQQVEELYYKFKPTRGHFACRSCGNPIYSHEAKFESTSGCADFDKCYEGSVDVKAEDDSLGHVVSCAACGVLLGHVYVEGGSRRCRTDQRHSIKSVALQYLIFDPIELKCEITLPLKRPKEKERRLGLVIEKEYPLGLHGAVLCLSCGSVVDFEGDAVVNAANQTLGGGEGINGALRRSGGARLIEAMEAVPVVPQPDGRVARCPPGEVRLTTGGDLKVDWCIHAVGPDYESASREGVPVSESDALLTAAYRNAMDCAAEKGIKILAFSLLSSGIFSGSRGLQAVLNLGVAAVKAGAYTGLKEVHLVAFGGGELPELIAACDESSICEVGSSSAAV